MKGIPVKTSMSPLECAVWAAEFARVRAGDSGHGAVGAAIDAADQAVMDVRDAFGTEHSSLAMRERRDDPDAQLTLLKDRLLRQKDGQRASLKADLGESDADWIVGIGLIDEILERADLWPSDPSTAKPLLVVKSPEEVKALRADDLLALYCRVMRETAEVFIKYETYVVRHWDGMDGCWTDCTGDVGQEEALRYWADRTDGGTRQVDYAEIDYYRIFPGGTRMHWDGAEGQEMHR